MSCAASRSYSCLPMMHEKPCVYVWSYWEDHTWRLCISNWIVKLAERLVMCRGLLLGHGASCHCAFSHRAQLLHIAETSSPLCMSASAVGLYPICPWQSILLWSMTKSSSAVSPALGRCCCKRTFSLQWSQWSETPFQGLVFPP